MGNDAYIFASKARECYYFDRKYNLLPGDCSDEYYLGSREYRSGYDALASLRKRLATKAEVKAVTDANIAYWAQNGAQDRHRVHYNFDIQDFIKRHPEDELYFVLGDYENCYDVIDNEDFKVIEALSALRL